MKMNEQRVLLYAIIAKYSVIFTSLTSVESLAPKTFISYGCPLSIAREQLTNQAYARKSNKRVGFMIGERFQLMYSLQKII